MSRSSLLVALLPLVGALASAEIQPQRINFQGKLISPTTNNPQTGPVNLTFNLYNAPTGGSSLYTETQNGVPLTNGVFSVQIGTLAAISRELFIGASVYLGVTVGSDAEMTPRQNLAMSAYAFTANQLSDNTEVRLIAGVTYATFTSAGNLTVPGGVNASSGNFANGVSASSGTFLATGAAQYALALSTSITFSQGVNGIGIRWGDGTISTTAAGGESTGLASVSATAALTGSGTSGSPLGVNSSSVAVFGAGQNLLLPYGITAASGAVTGAMGIGASGLANGTLVVQSTSAVAANPIISARTSAGVELLRIQDDGTFTHGPAGLVSTFTNTGDLHLSYDLYAGSATFTSGVTADSFTATEPTGAGFFTNSSATASAFFGDGSHLSGILSTASANASYVNITGDGMTGNLTMLSGSTITVTGNAFSIGGSSFVVTAGSASLPYQLVAGSIVMSGSTSTITTASSVTASSFFGNGSHLTNLGVLSNVQTFTSGTSYTPTAGTLVAVVELWGGGGAGGSCTNVAGCACGGGGSGGYAKYYFTGVGAGPYTISVSTGAAAVAGAAGTTANNTTFNTGSVTITAFGGKGGSFAAGTTATKYTAGGAGGAVSTNGTINGAGAPGGWGSTSATATIGATGAGGSTALGGGGAGQTYASAAAVAGVAAVANTGSGGSGGGTGTTTTAAGGAGAGGLIVVWEYK